MHHADTIHERDFLSRDLCICACLHDAFFFFSRLCSWPGGAESGDDSSQAGTTAAIVSAATLIPLMAVVALVCCWRRRQQKERGLKGAGSGQGSGVPVAGGGAAVAGGLTEMGDYRRTGGDREGVSRGIELVS